MSVSTYKVNYVFCFFILLMSLFLSGCGDKKDENNINSIVRPLNVPHDAMWIGGLDGGIYLNINKSENEPPLIYDVIIYFSVGEVDYKGKLKINSLEKPFDYTNVNSYSAWDGDTLYLRDGRQLEIPMQ